MEFGLLLPHFSEHSTWDRLIGFAPRIEALGFDSVWVRDNLSYYGHGFELPGNTFVDPFVTLSTIAGMAPRLQLGTAVAIPFRHPLVTAQLFGSLAWVARSRVHAGVGPGTPREPFDATGIPYEDRIQLCKEMTEVLRVVSGGPHVSYHGQLTSFEEVTLDPAPPPDMPIWYGGLSNASIRRIIEYCDGALPGRCPFRRWDVGVQRLEAGAAERGKRILRGTIPLITMARSREEALAAANLPALLEYLTGYWRTPYETVDDIAGALIAGTTEQCAEQMQGFAERNFDVVVLDARMQMWQFEEMVERIGEEILPLFRKAPSAKP